MKTMMFEFSIVRAFELREKRCLDQWWKKIETMYETKMSRAQVDEYMEGLSRDKV